MDVESGNIVGINACIRANMEGTSFAIPVYKVMRIVDDLSEGKHITYGHLGKFVLEKYMYCICHDYNILAENKRHTIPQNCSKNIVFPGVHMSTMNPTLARYSNKLQLQKNSRKIPEKEGVMIEKVKRVVCTLLPIF